LAHSATDPAARDGLAVSIAAGVATLRLDRPAVRNALDEALIGALDDALARIADDGAVRVVVLAGSGTTFCAGADLAWMRRAARLDDAGNREDALRLARMLARLATLPRPTIARVHGPAMGGGAGLAAACDICIASTDAVFALSEVRLGLIPAAISPHVVRAIGERQALRYFQSAERIDARRAREIGLAHEVVDPGELDRTVAGLCAALALGGPDALAAAKDLVLSLRGLAPGEAMVIETAARIARQRAGAEGREGVSAFLEKRPPSWVPPKG
jgi:methylglutaconyl-CoA hydratase